MRRVVILAGGTGTRLRPFTTVLPKPLMPIADRPILDIVIRQLARFGFQRITIASGYLSELIEAFFRDGSAYGVHIDYHIERKPLGTAGALASIDSLDSESSFLVMNGDVLTDLDYRELSNAHIASDAMATIATHRKSVEVSLGVMDFDDPAEPTRLTGYTEKPSYHYRVSMGVYCFSKVVLSYVEPDVYLDFPDLILRLLADGKIVRGYPFDGYWMDIGRHEDYEQAADEFEQHRAALLPAE
jgi:NDP-sugar pyrophosphorylase family protein